MLNGPYVAQIGKHLPEIGEYRIGRGFRPDPLLDAESPTADHHAVVIGWMLGVMLDAIVGALASRTSPDPSVAGMGTAGSW